MRSSLKIWDFYFKPDLNYSNEPTNIIIDLPRYISYYYTLVSLRFNA